MELAVKHLKCTKGGRNLFRNLTFSVRSGELLLLHGANGAGKSTLLRILAGLSSIEKGQIEYNSLPLSKQLTSYRTKIGYIGHKDGIDLSLTPSENITLGCVLAEKPSKSERLQSILSAWGLAQNPSILCHQLSQGQRRKVALGTLIAKNLPIWLLDEPLTALDDASVAIFKKALMTHLRNGGICVMATHAALDFPETQKIVQL